MKKVITVRKNQKLGEVIKNLVFDEEILYMIHIDKELIDLSELEVDTENSHKLSEDGYNIIMDISSKNWFFLWECKNQDKVCYTILTPYLYDYIYGHCKCKDIYIRRWGSKTKIDEE